MEIFSTRGIDKVAFPRHNYSTCGNFQHKRNRQKSLVPYGNPNFYRENFEQIITNFPELEKVFFHHTIILHCGNFQHKRNRQKSLVPYGNPNFYRETFEQIIRTFPRY
ncbi:MAG: hypothetical protein F6K40_04690 [Okeania sp. SIO3I5]|uniref:hypothetical protein n=1 Tax=Okeania sp. SIO3I5 TaxID=2607805 RepID=UPI0013B82EB8|nr:hypothetical protein [Okeania sp. SIO3I5]NEQ35633.1 hypothetical protein [Okeania sp. SIO3I5]